VAERGFVPIGEVLNILKGDHPDVTISKIRFLESQGLLDPERTPSGYRKFYPNDIERLRWILEQQRDHFLPLKVIKERLDHHPDAVPDERPVVAKPPAKPAAKSTEKAPARPAPARRATSGPPTESVAREDLVADTGLSVSQLLELTRFGLLEERRQGSSVYYDADSVHVARLAAAFLSHGVEARHLRMYRTAVEREAGFLEQLVVPMLKQRNPDAHRQAAATVEELWRLGDELRECLLRRGLRNIRAR
jgi:DNA-binding transcriptional MerR regulator